MVEKAKHKLFSKPAIKQKKTTLRDLLKLHQRCIQCSKNHFSPMLAKFIFNLKLLKGQNNYNTHQFICSFPPTCVMLKAVTCGISLVL